MKVNLTNGVSFGAFITVTDDHISGGKVPITFCGASGEAVDYPLAVVAVKDDGTSVAVEMEGATAKLALARGDKAHIIAQRAEVIA